MNFGANIALLKISMATGCILWFVIVRRWRWLGVRRWGGAGELLQKVRRAIVVADDQIYKPIALGTQKLGQFVHQFVSPRLRMRVQPVPMFAPRFTVDFRWCQCRKRLEDFAASEL